MRILGIDPGTEQSGYVVWDTLLPRSIIAKDIVDNNKLLHLIPKLAFDHAGIENVQLYQAVGKDIRETLIWIGRICQRFEELMIPQPRRIERTEIKMHFCGTLKKITDHTIRLALIDRFGGKGTKKNPGVFYGLKDHEWAAAAVAICLADTLAGRSR